MTNKEKYRLACDLDDSIPLPSRAWWLDAICGTDAWDVEIVEKDGQIVASLPYVLKRKFGLRLVVMPPFTPSLGVRIKYPEHQKYPNKLSYEKKMCTELIAKLPRFDRFHQRFHHSYTNWLPFYWAGFRETTRYTYILNDLSDLESVFSGFRGNIRGDIRKAEKRVSVSSVDDLEALLSLIEKSLVHQDVMPPNWKSTLRRLDLACAARSCRKIFLARDADGRLHAGLIVVWDGDTTYYLAGGGDPELRKSGATSLLLWEAIEFASTVSRRFDFEGSMIEQIERFFRAFGGVQTPYFSIYKNTGILKLVDALRRD